MNPAFAVPSAFGGVSKAVAVEANNLLGGMSVETRRVLIMS